MQLGGQRRSLTGTHRHATGTKAAERIVKIIGVCSGRGPDLRRTCCAPSATRTRDLLLRRHSRNVASHGSAWPHVQVSRIHHGWMWLGMALCLRSLAPRLAPGISLATLRFECSGPWGPPDGDPREACHAGPVESAAVMALRLPAAGRAWPDQPRSRAPGRWAMGVACLR